VINVAYDNFSQLTNSSNQNDSDPAFSPDGAKIVWTIPGPGGAVWIMDADGSHRHMLNEPPLTESFDTDWGVRA
jgi:Tol biopolymer transport system component